MVFDEIL